MPSLVLSAWIDFTPVIPWFDHGMTQWVLLLHASKPFAAMTIGSLSPLRNTNYK
ncbi:hypothetical protein [Rickettsia tamurae]|uniref:Uncharacterized protein n=1 Tax=Rickettsia tamurae subsp. buchneri TaxID=1462938 RepID=A0A8E0WMJ1_9RICK|nr:hypothetical protein [Rickettsia tamurae]EER22223.1 hypothetical protein REIS_1431 [Rickettsia endosymbiont of Ixodes scapularis]KDO03348.1 hypothetical protein REISMN_02140 [Rickettsia tamurae subsp. buchneri]